MAHYLSPIVSGLDKKSPIVASHLVVAAAAVMWRRDFKMSLKFGD
jgi:hypothetical protein